MSKSDHAAVSAMIRKNLRANNINGSVTSSSYSGGTSVRVSVQDLPPWTIDAIKSYCAQFQYGHFDGMTDMYEYSNSRQDVPQVKFLFIENAYSDELRQLAWDYLKGYLNGFEGAPASAKDACHFRHETIGEYCDVLIYRVLNGSMGKFWKKPSVRMAA